MLKTNSFTYTISSAQTVDRFATVSEGVIVFDKLPQGEYFVQCTAFIISTNNLINPPYIINLVARNFGSNQTYNAGNSLNSNQIVLSSIPTNVTSGACMQSGEGAVFRVRDMDVNKRVTFTLYDATLATKITTTTAPWATVIWIASFQFTPI
jgi:hypothetical protein